MLVYGEEKNGREAAIVSQNTLDFNYSRRGLSKIYIPSISIRWVVLVRQVSFYQRNEEHTQNAPNKRFASSTEAKVGSLDMMSGCNTAWLHLKGQQILLAW